MYVITNRKVYEKKKGLDVFGTRPNERGPNELRLVKVEKTNSGWDCQALTDQLNRNEVKALRDEFCLPIKLNDGKKWYASLKVACEVFGQARDEGKSIVFYTHGYNNDLDDILRTAHEIQKRYGVIVVPVSWPANGGGKITGTISYLSDKSDARASTGAMHQFVDKLHMMHQLLSQGERQKIIEAAKNDYKTNWAKRVELVEKTLRSDCKVKLILFCHSMGNYLVKKSLQSSGNAMADLVFDNICLVAADTNAHDHPEWVEKLDVRNQIYAIINEEDFALKASRIKPGEEQRARLGHSVKGLEAFNVDYIDVTGEPNVKSSHSYFMGSPVEKNKKLEQLFELIFQGVPAHEVRGLLSYEQSSNCHRLG